MRIISVLFLLLTSIYYAFPQTREPKDMNAFFTNAGRVNATNGSDYAHVEQTPETLIKIRTPITPIYLPDNRYGISGHPGFTQMGLSPVAEIGNANPASLFQYTAMSVGVIIDQASALRNFPANDIHTLSADGYLPSSAALVIPWQNFHLGLAYSRGYSAKVVYAEMPVITTEQPQGTGEFIHPINEVNLHNITAVGAYSFIPGVIGNDLLSFGLSIHKNFYKETKDWEPLLKMQASMEAVNWSIGSFYNSDKIALGIMFDKGYSLSGKRKIIDMSDIMYSLDKSKIFFKQPDVLRGEVSFKATRNFILSSGYRLFYWKNVNDAEYKNRTAFSVGAIYILNDFPFGLHALNLSFYRSKRGFLDETGRKEKSLMFLDAGLRFKIKQLNFTFQLRDSHIFNKNVYQQTVISAGVEYSLPAF